MAKPKQLLDLAGPESMIQATVSRLGSLGHAETTWVITNRKLVAPIAAQLPQLPPAAIVGEPCKRDTAPCVGLAAALVQHRDPDAIMLVMPADHVITPPEDFQNAVTHAVGLLEESPERIITFGIRPTYPAESFGYIERGESLKNDAHPTFNVARFKEKPSAEVAQSYLDSGSFYWNSGIFVWRAATILDALEKYEPAMFACLQRISQALGTAEEQDVIDREFAAIEPKSIDYAVMEHYSPVLVVEAPFAWDDVGNWQSLSRMHGQDEQGNTVLGRHLGIETEGSIIRSEGDHLIVTIGMQDCIVVHTPDATLVAHKDQEEAVRQVVKRLKERDWNEYL